MTIASKKMLIALRTKSGIIPDPPDWLVDINQVDTLVQRGYSLMEQNNMDIEFLGGLMGIIEAEGKRAKDKK